MGKKSRTPKKRSKAKPTPTPAPEQTQELITPTEESIHKALARAETLAQRGDASGAQEIYHAAATCLRDDISKNAGNDNYVRVALLARVLGQSGECQTSVGNVEDALTSFHEGIALLSPLVGNTDEDTEEPAVSYDSEAPPVLLEALASLYFYKGQVMESDEALTSYSRGVAFYERALEMYEEEEKDVETDVVMDEGGEEGDSPPKPDVDVRKQLCAAYCSIGELYLTDLCYHPNAETECESSIQNALRYDSPTSPPDALQAMANLRLSQCRNADALTYMLRVFDRMKKGCTMLASLVGLGPPMNKKEAMEPNMEAASSLPSFEFRIASAKLLLECAASESDISRADAPIAPGTTKGDQCDDCCEAALFILGSLLAEDDETIEVWYLIGCACVQFHEPNTDMAEYHWGKALQMMENERKLVERAMEEEEDDEVLDEMKQELECATNQIEDLATKLKGLGQKDDEGEEGNEMTLD
mmetsp:Transcript_42292/g.50724  ORF Transcript_42292/g.50724 Transcript_42292/m.50724 type:complete len:474 (+) Transcript_42292:99-1520(+)